MQAILKKTSVFLYLLFFILSPRFDLKIVVHAGFFSAALLFVVMSLKNKSILCLSRQLIYVATLFLMLAIYNFILALIYDNDGIYFSSICFSIIVSVVFGWMLASYLMDRGADSIGVFDQLLRACVMVAIFNSIVVLIEYIYPQVKIIIEGLLLQIQDGNINYAEHPFRLRGIANAGGASLSVFNALIIVFIIFLVKTKKLSAGPALFGSLILTCSNIFTGRTGLILSLFFTFALLILILAKSMKSGVHGGFRILMLILLHSPLLIFFNDFNLDPEAAEWAFEWIDGLGSNKLESKSSNDLKTMLFFPDDPIHLLFGIGFFEGVGKIYPRTDSGYLKSILSVGIPLSFLLYFSIIFMFGRIISLASKYLWFVVSVICLMLFVEIKEPFLYQNYAARVIFLLSGAAIFLLTERSSVRRKLVKVDFGN